MPLLTLMPGLVKALDLFSLTMLLVLVKKITLCHAVMTQTLQTASIQMMLESLVMQLVCSLCHSTVLFPTNLAIKILWLSLLQYFVEMVN